MDRQSRDDGRRHERANGQRPDAEQGREHYGDRNPDELHAYDRRQRPVHTSNRVDARVIGAREELHGKPEADRDDIEAGGSERPLAKQLEAEPEHRTNREEAGQLER